MSFSVKSPGLLSSIQDGGRWGHQKEGVLVNGAMDRLALRLGNLLVGNSAEAAALEITQVGTGLYFEEDHLIAITGADLSPSINKQAVKMWRPVWVKKGSLLEFGAPKRGRFAYLSVAGSFDVPPIMGSKSTYLRAGFGGHQGRSLQAGDLLPCGNPSEAATHLSKRLQQKLRNSPFAAVSWYVSPELAPQYEVSPTIRLIEGPEYHLFSAESQQSLWQEQFEVTIQSDRMGYRLKGKPLALSAPAELISSAVTFGTLQVPPNGDPIVLLADRQTTGGYPRIGQLASVDFSKLVQVLPGKSVVFSPISLQRAQQLYIAQEKEIAQFKQALYLKFKETI